MNAETIESLLKVGGSAGVLWVACFFLLRTVKEQVDKRIDAMEATIRALQLARDQCDADRTALHIKYEKLLMEFIEVKKKVESK